MDLVWSRNYPRSEQMVSVFSDLTSCESALRKLRLLGLTEPRPTIINWIEPIEQEKQLKQFDLKHKLEFEQSIAEGNIVISLRTDDPFWRPQIRRILAGAGARSIWSIPHK